MRRRATWRHLQLLLVFAVAVACSARHGDAARASMSGDADSTVARTDSTAARPDSTAARPDSTAARPDSVSTAPSDSTSAIPADSSAAGTTFKPKGETVLPDTLQFLPPPGSQAGGQPKAAGGAEKPKERTGLLGLTPIAILLGIAVLNYFIIKAVTH